MTFTFSPDFALDGEVVELDPPHRFAFLWGEDLLRFELAPVGDGTRLIMIHIVEAEGEPSAAKTVAGWHLCLDALERRLDGEHDADPPSGMSPEWIERYEGYIAAGVPSGAEVPGLDAG